MDTLRGESVLSGGEYGTLMHRMGRKSDAIGFAIYLDLLEGLNTAGTEYDVDVLLVYDENTDPVRVIEMKNKLIAANKSVCAQKSVPSKLRYKEKIDLTKEGNK